MIPPSLANCVVLLPPPYCSFTGHERLSQVFTLIFNLEIKNKRKKRKKASPKLFRYRRTPECPVAREGGVGKPAPHLLGTSTGSQDRPSFPASWEPVQGKRAAFPRLHHVVSVLIREWVGFLPSALGVYATLGSSCTFPRLNKCSLVKVKVDGCAPSTICRQLHDTHIRAEES